MRSDVTVLLGAALLAGCAVGPDYRRPDVEAGVRHRGALSAPEAGSIANLPWWELFGDEQLKNLIVEALSSNLDVRIAAVRVTEAAAALGIARADRLPALSATLQTTPAARAPGDDFTSSYLGGAALSWEIDLWGRYRRATEAARAQLLATEEARRAVVTSLVANTATLYLQIQNFLELIAITERTAGSQRESLRLVQRRSQAGVASAAEVLQAENQLASVEVQLPVLQRSLAQTEDALSVLLGQPPQHVPVAAGTPVLAVPPDVPAGLPSALIDRRPDIRAAEQNLVAANAQIGAAKALFFPNITLTGFFGRQSTSLSDVVSGGTTAATVSSLGADILQPIFQGGRLRANYDQARARAERLALSYRQTILQALLEVSDALVAYDRSRAEIDGHRRRVNASRELLRLTQKRYDAGVVSYLEVLDAQRSLYAAEVDLANAELGRRAAVVRLYKALGGGWNPRAPDVAPVQPAAVTRDVAVGGRDKNR